MSDSTFFLLMLIISALLLWAMIIWDTESGIAISNEQERLAAENERLKAERDMLADRLSRSYSGAAYSVRGQMYRD